jgi:hypothetical protein
MCSLAYARLSDALQLRGLTHAAAAPWTPAEAEAARFEWDGTDSWRGCSVLHLAATYDDVTLARAALATGAHVADRCDSAGDDGWTALHMTAYVNAGRVAALLLAAGADANAVALKDDVFPAPLHFAAREDALAVTQALLAAGADPLAPLHVSGSDVAPWQVGHLYGHLGTPTARLLASHAAAAALQRLRAAGEAAAAAAPLAGDAALVHEVLLRESGAILAGRRLAAPLPAAFAHEPLWARVQAVAYAWGVRSVLLESVSIFVPTLLAGSSGIDDAVHAATAARKRVTDAYDAAGAAVFLTAAPAPPPPPVTFSTIALLLCCLAAVVLAACLLAQLRTRMRRAQRRRRRAALLSAPRAPPRCSPLPLRVQTRVARVLADARRAVAALVALLPLPAHGSDAAPPPVPPPAPAPAPDSEAHTCVVCLEAQRAVLLLPCRHFVMCAACADGLPQPRLCPVCRQSAVDVVPVFM